MAETLIKKANECEDILSQINLEVFKFHNKPVDLQYLKSSEMSKDLLDELLRLTEANMKEFYEQSTSGWSLHAKLKELKHKDAKFLILRSNDKVMAFCHFRFDYGSDESEACVYCYELQVYDEYQRKGIGHNLMDILTQISIRFKLYKVMLTVFKHNPNAMEFYVDKCKFKIDRSSPSKFDQFADYEILSLKICKRAKINGNIR